MKKTARTVMNFLIFIVGLFIVFSIYLYSQQDKLIFMAPQIDRSTYRAFEKNHIEIEQDEQLITGWQIDGNRTAGKTVLYFGGNAEDVVYMNYEVKRFHVKRLYTFNYPGYGESSGRPSQKSLYETGLVIYDRLVSEYGVKPSQLVIVGRSLGSSVATYVASKRNVAGLILITPFDSIENIAAKHYQLFPVKILLNHRFPTIQYISHVEGKLLLMTAEQDEIITRDNFKRLEDAARQKNSTIRYANVGHNTIQLHPDYYRDINQFIESI